MSGGRLLRLAETGRPPLRLTIDGREHVALAGDTLLTAILTAQGVLRQSEFGDGPRAGFCLIGCCQDCWVRLADGRRLRACTTPAEAGMAVLTTREEADDGL